MRSPPESRIARAARGVAAQDCWAWGVATYLALLSTGTGAWLVWQLARLLDPAWTETGRAGGLGAIALVVAGALVVLFDLGRPSRFWRAAAQPRESWESRAALLIAAFVGLALAELGGVAGALRWTRWLALPAAVAAAVLLLYPALLLRGMSAYALWQPPWQLVLVAAGGLAAGCGLLALDPAGALSPAQLRATGIGLAIFGVIAGVASAAVVRAAEGGGIAGRAAAAALATGVQARLFRYGAVGVGLVVPVLIGTAVGAGGAGAAAMRVAAIAAIVGLAMMRHAMLVAAHRPTELTFAGDGPWGLARPADPRP
jgi:formate-dependent nitrite reductase membrane component NrfD